MSAPNRRTKATPESLLERIECLITWLTPASEGHSPSDEAGRFIGRPAREIAAAFNERFGLTLHVRTVQGYIAKAEKRAEQSKALDPTLPLPTRRRRGRPKLQKTMPQRRRGPSDDFSRLRGRVLWEILALTGWSASRLYRHMTAYPGFATVGGKESNYYRCLKLAGQELALPRLTDSSWTNAGPSPDREHRYQIRLHQVVMRTPDDDWAVLLLAFEPCTSFVHAILCSLPQFKPAQLTQKAPGRPPAPDRKIHAVIRRDGDEMQIRLPVEALLQLIYETISRSRLNIVSVLLHPSLGDLDHLVKELTAKTTDARYHALTGINWHCHPLAWPTPLKALCTSLTRHIRFHNAKFARHPLKKQQAYLNALVEQGKVSKARLKKFVEDKHHLYPENDPGAVVGRSKGPTYEQIRIFHELNELRTSYPRGRWSHLKVKIQPIPLKAEVEVTTLEKTKLSR